MRTHALVLAIALAVGLAQPARAASPEPDYSGFQKVLDQYLSVESKQPLVTRFDYIKFYKDTTRTVRMAKTHTALTSVDPKAMDHATRLSWGINTYNFLVIESATAFLWRRVYRGWERFHGPREITVGGGTFFSRIACKVDSASYSLDEFERHFVFYDHAKRDTLPPQALDARAHFALVCAAIGCPPLRPRVYRADSLDHELDVATREVLADPAYLRWDEKTGVLEASEIFEWYPGDFGGPSGELRFIRRYGPKNVAVAIEKGRITGITRYIPWNWKFNQTP